MALASIQVEQFRNLRAVDVRLSPTVTVITGGNAAGKTSLLEAIHCLSQARSFRSTPLDQLIAHDADAFVLRGRIDQGNGDGHRIVFQRQRGCSRLRLNTRDIRTLSTVANLLPVQVINTESQRLLTDSPDIRRSLLNWGVFHVEHQFGHTWSRYRRALRQRNLALRQRSGESAAAWERQLGELGEQIDVYRRDYAEALAQAWNEQATRWLDVASLAWHYFPGWDANQPLASILQAKRDQELDLGYTLNGPHRADLRLRHKRRDAHQTLSRGQQKLAVIAMRLAQLAVQMRKGGTTPIVLVDDLAAELDPRYRERVCEALIATGSQVVLTSTEPETIGSLPVDARMFHVEQGCYREMV